MSQRVNVVTGGTGLLGSHLIEQLVEQGEHVRALVRPNSDKALLQKLGVECVNADLGDPGTLGSAVQGADIVYHCAARVSDWGPWRLFQEQIIDTTANLLAACRAAKVGRFLHVSSSRVYGHPGKRAKPLSEDEPLGQRLWRLWDYYPRAKIETEKLCRAYQGEWTIVRPTWVYGLRDRNTLPRLIRTLQLGQGALIGPGDNLLNIVFARDVADGMIRAAGNAAAIGQVYNLGAVEKFTQRQFLGALTEALGQPALTRHVPYWLAFRAGFVVELVGKALGVKRNLRVTRHGVSLMGISTGIASDKAREQLGWVPSMAPLEGLRRTVEWYFGPGGGQLLPCQGKSKSWLKRCLGTIFKGSSASKKA